MEDIERQYLASFSEEARLIAFLTESLKIEGIHRPPSAKELAATTLFLDLKILRATDVYALQAVYAPEKPLRDKEGMNVQVGSYMPPFGGGAIPIRLACILDDINNGRKDPWRTHVEFEALHPFMDGNGRTGRTLWAYQMKECGQDPFALPFLHRFYYQTLGQMERW